MCYACNPMCGRCKPKRAVSVTCPRCGAPASLKREEYLLLFDLPHEKNILERRMEANGGVERPVCEVCGADLVPAFRAAVEPAECGPAQIVCGYPCGRAAEAFDPQAAPCPFRVPLSALDGVRDDVPPASESPRG